MKKVFNVTEYLENNLHWEKELILLRDIILSEDLTETIKWNAPTYTNNGKNIIGIGAFKHHFGLWFFQGSLINDTYELLTNAQDGKTQALRQMRFTSINDIQPEVISIYIKESIQNFKKGKIIKPQKNKAFEIPELLVSEFNRDTPFQKAFNSLSQSKQREYSEYITEAKKEATKLKRLEKIIPMITSGIGLYDKYKNC